MDLPGFRNRLWRRRYHNQPHLRHHHPYLPPLAYRQPGPARGFLSRLRNLPRRFLSNLLWHLHPHLLSHSSPAVDRLHRWLIRHLWLPRRPP